MAPATDTFSRCPAFSLISGGWPRNDQLRRRKGAISKPLSSSSTVMPESGDPAAYAAGVDAEEVGNFLGGVSLADALDGEKPPTLEFSGCSYGSHARTRCKPRAERALLSSEPIPQPRRIGVGVFQDVL